MAKFCVALAKLLKVINLVISVCLSVHTFFRMEKLADPGQIFMKFCIFSTHFMVDTKGYKHTLRICNTYFISTV